MSATVGAMMAYAHGTSSIPLLGQTLGDNLRQTAERFPNRDALVVRHQNYRASYRRLWEETTALGRALLALDLHPGDRVGIWAPNRWEWVVVQYATARLGLILVNINPSYLVGELEYSLNQSGIAVLLHAQAFRNSNYDAMVQSVRPNCPTLRLSFNLDTDWQSLLDWGSAIDPKAVEQREATLQFDDAINIQYTSGTTGNPKGATLTHHNLLNNAYFTGLGLGYTPADRVCIPVPFYHCFGMVLGNLACTSHGACMVVPSESFQPRAVLEAVQAERCTSLYGVPTMFRAILEVADFASFDCTSLRTGIMAGAPCPIELMREVVERLHMREVAIGYGMTETSPLSTLSGLNDDLDHRCGTVGQVLPHLEISIREPGTRALLRRGEPGEFCTRGYSVMPGYWNDEKATNASIDAAGWMHSGDLATMDDSGHVRIVGRLKDMIIRGGENIYPREIEAVLHSHTAISEVQIVGIPSHKYGEEVMAFVRLAPDGQATTAELETYCRARLASFKVPRYWHFLEVFPMTVTGKVQKFRLREMAIEILGRQSDAAERTA